MKSLMPFLFMIASSALGSPLLEVPGGNYRPLLGKGKEVEVSKFHMAETPVTNSEYLKFVKANPEWRKSAVKKIFADAQYLDQWAGDLRLGKSVSANAPVTHVSWFAAQAYCESQGLSLPSISQWEYVAQFGPENQKKDVKSVILEWYSKPTWDPLESTCRHASLSIL